MLNMDAIEAGETILRCIDYILTRYPENQEGICEYDKQTQDLLHQIELTNFAIGPGYKLAKQLQEVRRGRRGLKDENELLKGLFEYLSQGSSMAFKNGLINAVTKAKQRERMLPLRTYAPRSQAFGQEPIDNEPEKEEEYAQD